MRGLIIIAQVFYEIKIIEKIGKAGRLHSDKYMQNILLFPNFLNKSNTKCSTKGLQYNKVMK